VATTDPRTTIKAIIEAYIVAYPVTRDDCIAIATVISLWESGPETLKPLFATYDIVITFGEPRSRSVRPIQDVPVHFNMSYPITVTTVNKPLTGVALVCTAARMQYKVTLALRAAIQGSAQSAPAAAPAYTIRIMDDAAKHTRIGGLDVWQATHSVQYETDYP